MGRPRQQELDEMLRATLEDRRLSRTERRALREVMADYHLDAADRSFVRHRVFAIAREQIHSAEAQQLLDWAEEVVKLVQADVVSDPTVSEVHFSPGDECRLRISRLLRNSEAAADICVFTITDDRLAADVLAAHGRGVSIRIITDNDKAEDLGSDIHRFARAGVQVRLDRSEHHMHHKFALFDRTTVLTGSYNWTRSAADYNRENLVVSDDARIVSAYQSNFDEFWETLGVASPSASC